MPYRPIWVLMYVSTGLPGRSRTRKKVRVVIKKIVTHALRTRRNT